jgi:hypothetical protein
MCSVMSAHRTSATTTLRHAEALSCPGGLAAAICFGIVLLGCAGEHKGGRYVSLRSARKSLVAAFEQGDTLEVYTRDWPGEENTQPLLAVISRDEAPDRWEAFIDAARRAGPRTHHRGLPILWIRIRAGRKVLASGWAYPPADEIALWLPSDQVAAAVVGPAFNDLLSPIHEETKKAMEKAYAEYAEDDNSSSITTLQEPALLSFEEVKARFVTLFQNCDYINIHAPEENSMGVNVRKEGREAWQIMTKAIAEAEKGWAIPGGQAEVYIWCEDPEAPSRLIELHYVAGIVGATHRYYGGNVHTLHAGPAFKQGLDSILTIAREEERRGKQSGGQ